MSAQANILHDSPVRAEAAIAPPIAPLQLFRWSVQRELWDNKSLYIAPVSIAVAILIGFLFSPIGIRNLTTLTAPQEAYARLTAAMPYDLAAALIMSVSLIVGVFYSADALFAERRDRSILFWKSLPVSDTTSVLAKASIPLLVLPLITFAVTVVAHLVMALASSVALLRLGDPVAPLWSLLALPHMWLWLFGHLFATAALWYAPFYAWLLFVSSWATRAPLLLAFLPPIVLSALEAIAFHTTFIGRALLERIGHGNFNATSATRGNTYIVSSMRPSALTGLNTPELWFGLIAAALFLAATVQLRRYRGAL